MFAVVIISEVEHKQVDGGVKYCVMICSRKVQVLLIVMMFSSVLPYLMLSYLNDCMHRSSPGESGRMSEEMVAAADAKE